MNRIFNKVIMFLGFAIMTLGLGQSALFAASKPPPVDPVTAAIEAFAAPYETGTTAFNLPLYVQGGKNPLGGPVLPAHTTYTTGSITNSAGTSDAIRIYYLGSLDDPQNYSSKGNGHPITRINWVKDSVDNYTADLFNTNNSLEIYDYETLTIGKSASLAFEVQDQMYTPDNIKKSIYSLAPLPGPNDTYRFYPISGIYDGKSLNGYYLVAYTAIVYNDQFVSGWNQVGTKGPYTYGKRQMETSCRKRLKRIAEDYDRAFAQLSGRSSYSF
jgi:hypothetical protein